MTSRTRTRPPVDPRPNPASGHVRDRRRARAIGILFLAAMFTYGPGSGIVASIVEAPDSLSRLAEARLTFTSGAVLMLLNSAVVIAIGVLVFPVLRRANERVALGYYACRVVEGGLLALGVIALLAIIPVVGQSGAAAPHLEAVATLAVAVNDVSYQVAMASLGLGSLFFCAVLYQRELVPRALTMWGLAGYATFLAGTLLELFGVGVGLLLAIPGGLFEVFFGGWLIVKGFASPTGSSAVDG